MKEKITPLREKSEGLLQILMGLLDDKQAEKVVVLDLNGKSAMADYMIVAEGKSSRQLVAVAHHIQETLKTQGILVSIEGLRQCDWVLIDAGDIIVHLFHPEARSYYDLEGIWTVRGEGSEKRPPSISLS